MLLLKPSVVVIIRLDMILVGSVISVMARGEMMGIGIYFVSVNRLFSCPFVQNVGAVPSW